MSTLLGHELRRVRAGIVPRLVFLAIPIGLSFFLAPTFDLAMRLDGIDATGWDHIAPGLGAMFSCVVLIFMGYSVFDDHGSGVWNRMRSGGTRGEEIIGSKAIAMFGHLAVHMTAVLLVASLIGSMSIRGSIVALGVVVAVMSAMLVSYGVLAAVISRTNALYNVFAYVGALVFAAMGGALVPLTFLPSWARAVAPASPLYWPTQAMRTVIIDGGGVSDIVGPLVAMTSIGAALLALAVWRFDPNQRKEAFDI